MLLSYLINRFTDSVSMPRSFGSVTPAKAEVHNHAMDFLDSRIRGNDKTPEIGWPSRHLNMLTQA